MYYTLVSSTDYIYLDRKARFYGHHHPMSSVRKILPWGKQATGVQKRGIINH